MVEHSIKTWERLDGTWDVTHHSQAGYNDGYLHDVEKDFRNFPTREAAEVYAMALFKRVTRGKNRVELESPETWGKQVSTGWSYHSGPRWRWLFSKGKTWKEP